jgi:hypothetical protein
MSERDNTSLFHLLNLYELPDDYVLDKYSVQDVLNHSRNVTTKDIPSGSLASLEALPWYVQAER